MWSNFECFSTGPVFSVQLEIYLKKILWIILWKLLRRLSACDESSDFSWNSILYRNVSTHCSFFLLLLRLNTSLRAEPTAMRGLRDDVIIQPGGRLTQAEATDLAQFGKANCYVRKGELLRSASISVFALYIFASKILCKQNFGRRSSQCFTIYWSSVFLRRKTPRFCVKPRTCFKGTRLCLFWILRSARIDPNVTTGRCVETEF